MKLLEFIINREQGTGNKQTTTSLRDAPLPQAGRKQSQERARSGDGHALFVILNEVKDLKARFFANEAQNDKIKNGCASRVEPSPGQERNPAYKGNISQNDEMKESGTRRAECPSLPVPRYCARVRHSAEANQASKTGGVRNKSGFRPTGLNDEIEPVRRGFISLRKSPNEQTASGRGSLLLRKEDRASRVQPRNPAYENNQNDKKPTPHPLLPQAGRKQSQERVKKGCVTLTRACGVANFQHRWFMNEDPHPRSLRSRNQPLAGLRLPQKREGLKTAPFRMTFVVVCLLLLLVLVSPVAAQVPTTRLFFNPTPLQIDTTISPTGVVSLEVADGVDIFAFDLFVQYDPTLLRVSQVIHGEFLGMGLLCMDQINNPGLVHYSCTRFRVDTGVSGSGVLLELTFEALGQGGDTTLTLDGSALYESQDAFLIDATLEDGAVSVRPYLTYVPLILTASGQGMEAMP
ncbi:MAG: cohesin domain-containing protein [Anaerolineaceae bacterium]